MREAVILVTMYCVWGWATGWRLGSGLMLAALLAGCADMPEYSKEWGAAMATPAPAMQAMPQPDDREPPAPAVTPPQGSYSVQIAAPRNEADARALIDTMRVKHAGLLAREWATIHRVELPNGVFYRVMIGPIATEQQASQLCSSLKAQGASCFIRGT